MFQPPRPVDVQKHDSLTCVMDSPQLSTPPPTAQPLPSSASSSNTPSPALSLFSKGPTARSGSTASSVDSSPALRDSFENFSSSKRLLTDVKEDPLEREDAGMTDTSSNHSGTLPLQQYSSTSLNSPSVNNHRTGPFPSPPDPSTLTLPSAAHYNFSEDETTEVEFSANLSFKKRRAGDSPGLGVANRFGTRFPSVSRKWKSKTGASPKLSIITHSDAIRSRTNSVSSQLVSPALSAISKHESLLPSSPIPAGHEESSSDILVIHGPIDIGQAYAHIEEDRAQATTPLLPPIMTELSSKNLPIHSPLQSPTVAETQSLASSTTPSGTPQLPCLPSPPLSTKPSIASMRQRSRAGTILPSSEIPSLQMLDQQEDDGWSAKLGHANFTIYPEPYLPKVFDLETFKLLREDWDHARHSYAKHLARTGEHYGTTSKTYLLTEEKWASIDCRWKNNSADMSNALGHLIARSSGGDARSSDPTGSGTVLEQAPTKVVVPQIHDPTGKFPDMGDEDIVGPMAVAPSRGTALQHMVEPAMQSRLAKKRNFLRFISDILGRGVGGGLRT